MRQNCSVWEHTFNVALGELLENQENKCSQKCNQQYGSTQPYGICASCCCYRNTPLSFGGAHSLHQLLHKNDGCTAPPAALHLLFKNHWDHKNGCSWLLMTWSLEKIFCT